MQLWSGKRKTHRRGVTMRFMMIVKSAEKWGFPPKPLMDAIAKLSDEAGKAGTMIGNGGLLPTATGARPPPSRGNATATDRPLPQAKEVGGGSGPFSVEPAGEARKTATPFTAQSSL